MTLGSTGVGSIPRKTVDKRVPKLGKFMPYTPYGKNGRCAENRLGRFTPAPENFRKAY
jgi:hypothetical protein